ncbi:MAG: polyphosphate kinase [Cryomorphaceae bacterium]|jgi:polyphosphate kinase
MSTNYINRELSWIEFNQRVLSEAQRDDLPILERVKFLAITASNLDEFFQVRVGGLSAQLMAGSKKTDLTGLTPGEQLNAIRARTKNMYQDFSELLEKKLTPELAKNQIYFTSLTDLSHAQRNTLTEKFNNTIFPILTPLGFDINEDENESTPILPAHQITLIIRLQDADKNTRTAFIPIPSLVDRLHYISDDKALHIITAEELISHHAQTVFPDETIIDSSHFRITRNGDIVLQDEDAMDIAGEMEDILNERKFSKTIRLEIPADISEDLLQTICTVTNTDEDSEEDHIYRITGAINLADYMPLAFLPGHDALRDPEWTPQPSPAFSSEQSMFETIAEKDVLLYHPYESFEPVIRLIEEASTDPYTLAIKQVLYRTASNSRIIDALIRAAENGKQVTVLVELKARFDEARNLQRADELQRAGVQIVYGVKNLKTHAKILLIVRNENGNIKRYLHLGTGNYNESTAKLYTDASYLTARDSYGADASVFFNAITGRSKLTSLKKLTPAPTEMKRSLISKIEREAKRAKQGEPAHIIAKINSLQDQDIIDALYAASAAGVKIQLNIRGICCLKPKDKILSKNIEVISVIDRYLEHARIFYFHKGGNPELFIASADWMTRNLEKRVELMIPIADSKAKKRLTEILKTAFNDNQNAHLIQKDGTSIRKAPHKGRGKGKTIRLQSILQEAAEKATKAKTFHQSTTFEPHKPS